MTPQPAPHLTTGQLDALLACASVPAASAANRADLTFAEAHLLACPQCAAELAHLRDSLSLFRDATTAHADQLLRRTPPISLPSRAYRPALEPAYWVAAAAMGLAALLPLRTLRQQSFQPPPVSTARIADHSAESDEALLDDVNRDITAAVPASMQALDDPTGAAPLSAQASTETSSDATDQTSDPRKD
jgi:hypothetical protein